MILTDNSKLDKTLPYTFADFSMIDTIITDRVVPQEIADEARKSGTKIIVANLGV